MLHRTQQSAEAGSSSATPNYDQTASTTTVVSRDVEVVPKLSWDEQAVHEIIDGSKWRRAVMIDGELRWATQERNTIGRKVGDEGDLTWKIRQLGDWFYLAPKEAHEGAQEDVQAANNKRVDTFLASIAANMIAQSTEIPPPTHDSSEHTHGYIDNDFDNPGPRVNEETQYITRGYHALMNRDKDPVFKQLDKLAAQASLSLGRGKDGGGEEGDQDLGYESGGSEVSMEQCRESPAYPICKEDCWLKQALSRPSADQQPKCPTLDASGLGSASIYGALDPCFTRVLVIAPGTCDEQIRCTLAPMEIQGIREQNESSQATRPVYEALSYTWGDATIRQIIECNGELIGVSQNLFDALVNTRLAGKSRTIWIDALCIDQKNDAEKSDQVQYMYAIYRAAAQVIVWLGVGADDSDFAMSAMSLIGRRKNRVVLMRHDHDHECLVQLARLIRGVETLTERPWFSRSWIRQEVAAAPKVIVRCGSFEIPWIALKRSVNCLSRLRSKYIASRPLFKGDDDEHSKLIGPDPEKSYALTFLKKDWVLGQSLLAGAGDISSIWYYHTGGMLDLLMASRAYEATNNRDKVYAILGMAEVPINNRALSSTSARAQERERPTMRVDYSASIPEVYQYTAKYLINRDGNLDILCILPTHRDATSFDLPSWTPDWRVPLSSRPLYDNWDYISYKWGASGFTRTETQEQDSLGRLAVSGFEIARVQQLEMLFPEQLPHPPERPAGSAILFDESKHARRFAQTTRGPSVVPSAAVVGDAIWILYGCRMPVVLRPAGGALDEASFEVVGPCYVSTMMFGEALVWLEKGLYDLELASIELV
ncbi:hypothetical protein E8E11_003636 [Didymella keratinophila]|nr:hypothetical protein E8E11_003636 [Didymella keratinophila]